jgi:hypothetical protein
MTSSDLSSLSYSKDSFSESDDSKRLPFSSTIDSSSSPILPSTCVYSTLFLGDPNRDGFGNWKLFESLGSTAYVVFRRLSESSGLGIANNLFRELGKVLIGSLAYLGSTTD